MGSSKSPTLRSATDIFNWADTYLRIAEIADWPNAVNGVQVENSGKISKIAAAVDLSTQTIQTAASSEADLLIVHHGMFWPGLRPVTKAFRRQLQIAFENDIAVYSAHLPLDVHEEIGNNVLLMRAVGIRNSEPFLAHKNSLIGRTTVLNVPIEEFVAKLETAVAGPVRRIGRGHAMTGRLGVISGGAGDEIERVASEGIDTFLTGEAPHWAAVAASDLGINLLLAGHYATETFGVKALAAHLAGKFQLDWQFIDLPTGL